MKRLVRTKSNICSAVLILLIGLVGCGYSHTATSENSQPQTSQEEEPKERAGAVVANSPVDLYPHLKRIINTADEIRFFNTTDSPTGKSNLVLVRTFKSGGQGFTIIKAAFFEDLVVAEVSTAVAESKIVFLKVGKEVYELNYCKTDGRVEDARNKHGSQTLFFMPYNVRKLLE